MTVALEHRAMRGFVIGSIFSLALWTLLAWSAVLACTCLDITWLSASSGSLFASFACINFATIAAAAWIWQECLDAEFSDALDLTPTE